MIVQRSVESRVTSSPTSTIAVWVLRAFCIKSGSAYSPDACDELDELLDDDEDEADVSEEGAGAVVGVAGSVAGVDDGAAAEEADVAAADDSSPLSHDDATNGSTLCSHSTNNVERQKYLGTDFKLYVMLFHPFSFLLEQLFLLVFFVTLARYVIIDRR